MPQSYIRQMAKKHGMSISSAEQKWNKAKTIAAEQGHEEEFDYITGIFKKMVGESVNLSERNLLKIVTHNIKKKIKDEHSPSHETSADHQKTVKTHIEGLKEGKMSELSAMIDEELEKYAQRHGDEYTAAHMDKAKAIISAKIAKAYDLSSQDAKALVDDALGGRETENEEKKTNEGVKITFKEYLIGLE